MLRDGCYCYKARPKDYLSGVAWDFGISTQQLLDDNTRALDERGLAADQPLANLTSVDPVWRVPAAWHCCPVITVVNAVGAAILKKIAFGRERRL